MNRDEQERLLEITRHDGRAQVATRKHTDAGVHDETALGDALLLGVTFVTTLREDRANVLLEELEPGGVHLLLGRCVGGPKHAGRGPGEGNGE